MAGSPESINTRNKEYRHNENIIIKERYIFPNGFLLLIARDCPSIAAKCFIDQTKQFGDAWFLDSLRDPYTFESRRNIYLPELKSCGEKPVFKKKRTKPNAVHHVSYFTQSVIHEMRTSRLLAEVVEHSYLPKTLDYQGVTYAVTVNVQQPWGALLNTYDKSTRYGIFEYISGWDIRDEVTWAGNWSYLSDKSRELYQQIAAYLEPLGGYCIENGLEPFDFGLHQIVYDLNEQKKEIRIGILDTEEFNLTQTFGKQWQGDASIPNIFLAQIFA